MKIESCLDKERVKEALSTPPEERTKEQHLFLMNICGGAREYLLSMGKFKEITWEELGLDGE